MKSVSVAMAAHLLEATTTLCTCWRITRKDGVILGFTDHDQDIVLPDEPDLIYVAETGYYRSAITNSATTSADTLQVSGFLDSDNISDDDLKNHAYDYAAVEIFAVNWADLTMGIIRLRYGLFGESVRYPSGEFQIELRGLIQLFSQTVGRTIAPECDADLGDTRCTVKLIPDERLASAPYKTGDRILFPVDGVGHAYRLPLLNANFEFAQTSALYNWTFQDCQVQNLPPYIAADGSAYVIPVGTPNTGHFQTQWSANVNQIGTATLIHNFTFKQYQIADHWQARGVIEIFDLGGFVVTTLTSSWAATALGVWTSRTVDGANNLINVNGFRIRVEWRYDPAFFLGTPPDGPAPILFDDIHLSTDGNAGFPRIYSPSFELADVDLETVYDWTGIGGIRRIANLGMQPQSGEAYLRVGGLQPEKQTVRLDTITGVTTAALDGGEFEVELSGWVGAEEYGYYYHAYMQFYSQTAPFVGVDTPLGTVDSGLVEARPQNTWFPFSIKGKVPAGTRSVVVFLDGSPTARQTSTLPKTVYDNLVLNLFDPLYQTNTFEAYGGVEFEAQNDGITGDSDPTFSTTLAATVTDGTVVWETVAPKYTFLATVASVTDFTNFVLAGISSAVDNWFQFGVCFFITGRNANRAIEVSSSIQSSGAVVTALPLLWQPQVGDKVRIHAGCDKSRGVNGCGRYDNILNFRGFPDVPGTDEYFKVGGVGT